MDEPRDVKLKRLKMRSMRRGIKEMDLILMAYANASLERLSDADLATYDQLLSENDHDIFAWVMGRQEIPNAYQHIMADVCAIADGVTKPGSITV